MIGTHRFLDVEQAHVLAQAINETCTALHIPKEDIQSRAIIAARVADLARAGIDNAGALRDRVLAEANTEL